MRQGACSGDTLAPEPRCVLHRRFQAETRIIDLKAWITGEWDDHYYPTFFIADNDSLGVIVGQIT